jgi:hypothetical protein
MKGAIIVLLCMALKTKFEGSGHTYHMHIYHQRANNVFAMLYDWVYGSITLAATFHSPCSRGKASRNYNQGPAIHMQRPVTQLN